MSVKNVEKENGSATLILEVEKERFDAATDQAYRQNRKNILVPGFRKGKAPRKVIEGMYGASVFYDDAINILFPEVYDQAIKEAELKVVGMPSVTDMDLRDGVLTLTVKTDLYPEVTLGEYKDLEAPKTEPKVTAAEVDEDLKAMAERNARIQTVDRPAQNGDTVVLDYEGFDNGVAFEGGKAEGYSLKLGSGTFIPGFEDALVGVKAGEDKDINVTFPEEYGAKELAGKPVVFKCKVHEVKETILPELDDEFAKDVSEFDTLKALKDDLKAKKLEAKKQDADTEFRNAVLDLAVANMECQVPDSMVDEQTDKTMQQYEYQMQMNGMKLADYAKMLGTNLDALRASLRPDAEAQIRMRLMLEKVAEVENIEVSDADLDKEFEDMSKQYNLELEQLKKMVSADDIRADLKLVRAGDLIVANAKAAKKTTKKAAEAEGEEKPAAKKSTAKKSTKKAEEAEGEEKPAKKPAAKKTAKTKEEAKEE